MKGKNDRLTPIGEDELASPDRKLRYNRRLFAVVAPRYDLVTRLLSLGRDAAWKRMLLEMLPPDQEWSRADAGRPAVLDLACGTGDITVLLARRYPRGAVLGLDLTEEMLVRARDRVLASSRARARAQARARAESDAPFPEGVSPRFIAGDMNALEMADGTLDIVTGGYALRNAPDLEHTLREIFRVLRPGGTAAFLEFSRARHPLAGTVQLGILRVWGRLWGLILHGDPEVYAYIARSLAGFPDRIELEELFSRVGFRECPGRTLMMGFARITVVTRP